MTAVSNRIYARDTYVNIPIIFHKVRYEIILGILIAFSLLIAFGNSLSLVNGQVSLLPLRSTCFVCFYTVEDEAIELGLVLRRTDTPLAHMNFDFTDPLNGKLKQTRSGILYTPTTGFVGNDTFIIQIKNNNSSSGYSTIPVKIVVVSSDRVDKGTSNDTILLYISAFSSAIAGGGLIYTAAIFRKNSRTLQIQSAIEIINDLQRLDEKGLQILDEMKAAIDSKDMPKLNRLRMKEKAWITELCDKLEWFAFLIIKERVKENDLIEFFKDYFIGVCENILCKKYPDKLKDRSRYAYIIELYKKLAGKDLCPEV